MAVGVAQGVGETAALRGVRGAGAGAQGRAQRSPAGGSDQPPAKIEASRERQVTLTQIVEG